MHIFKYIPNPMIPQHDKEMVDLVDREIMKPENGLCTEPGFMEAYKEHSVGKNIFG